MKKKINFIVMLVLIGALVGLGTLVKNNQNIQRGATFANVEALFLPATRTVKVGEKFVSTLMIDTKSHYLTGADLRVKYDPKLLRLETATALSRDSFEGGVSWLQNLGEVLISEINAGAGTYNLVGTNTQKDVSGLPTGVVSVVKLNFIAIANGEAKVALDESYSNVVTGYNSSGSDQELKIETVRGATYSVVGSTEPITTPMPIRCDWCGTNCIDFSKQKDIACPMIYVSGKSCVNQNGRCVIIPKVTVAPTKTVSCVLCGEVCVDANKMANMGVCAQIMDGVNRVCVTDSNGSCKMLIRYVQTEPTKTSQISPEMGIY